MKHLAAVTHVRPALAAWCVNIPVVPGTAAQTALKELLGWEQVEADGVGVSRWCKPCNCGD